MAAQDSQLMSSVRIHGITLTFTSPIISILFVTATKIHMQRIKSAFQGYCRNYSLSEDGAVRPFLSKKNTFNYKKKFNLCGNPKIVDRFKI